ncbi:MAG: glycosyltransferase family 2 protein [Acidimicrobiia bacterium]
MQPAQALVAVVIPTHNRPEALRSALRSVLSQQGASFEVVVVDDGSDPPVAIGDHDPRIRVLRNDRPQGPAAARNKGAAATSAPLIAFLDDDDSWREGKLGTTIACLDAHPDVGLAYHLMSGAQEDGGGKCRVLDDPVRRMLTRQPPHLDSVVIRRQLHEAVLFDEAFGAAEDLDYLLRAAESTSVLEIGRILADHGQKHVSSIGLPKRIEARKQFREKHSRYFQDREVAAFHHVRLGHLYRLTGERFRAIESFLRAIRFRPTLGLGWTGLARAVMPR